MEIGDNMKKTIVIAIINLLAFLTILAFIRNEFGYLLTLKIFIPAVLIFSTHLSMVLTVFSPKKDDDSSEKCK